METAGMEKVKTIALAGNPNVGKSTVFNAITGMKQHTGNWPGKTVATAQGSCTYQGTEYRWVDLPGTYSLLAHSAEEEVARDFICFGGADATVIVCDATCLERNLNLVLQTLEITGNALLCINLMDEAKKKGILIDTEKLSDLLDIPVITASARSGKGIKETIQATAALVQSETQKSPYQIPYTAPLERAIEMLSPLLEEKGIAFSRWAALRLLSGDKKAVDTVIDTDDIAIKAALSDAMELLSSNGVSQEKLQDQIVACTVLKAEDICNETVSCQKEDYDLRDRRLDKILLSRITGIPIMLLLLCTILWLTITGANYPSALLSKGLFFLQDQLMAGLSALHLPEWLCHMLVYGVYRELAWVVAVMLPPMMIFFPLFTLLEDLGYLPRVAFNLDRYFKAAGACGKQALTMCMGFGCNAAGVTGCRIIDSPRERLIAVITNSFVPCNGRFPTIIAVISMFFVGTYAGFGRSFLSALMLTGVILLGILITFWVSRLLSATLLKGTPSSFTLELPPYRRPQIGKVIIRSVFDRTLFVLGRAVMIAAPAGLVVWLLANITWDGISLLTHIADFLDPFAYWIGLDGVILMAFILGFPANEIVIPIAIMTYLSAGSLTEMSDLFALKELLTENGWTWLTALCTILFSLLHWPCSTTCLTIYKETGSRRWTALSFALPTLIGIAVCFTVTLIARLTGSVPW